MNGKLKVIINYAVIFIFIFIFPTLLLHYFKRSDTEQFNKWVNEDYEICLRRAKEDSINKNWCSEIRNASKTTYNSANSSSNTNMLLIFFQPVLFVLLITVSSLRKQIEELKGK